MILFELEERFNVDLLGAVGLIKQLVENEKFRRAAMGRREDVEQTVGAAQGEIDWSAIRKRIGDLLRAGNNLLLMTDIEILISVANFCRVKMEDLKKEKSKLVDVIKEVRTKIQDKTKIRKTVQAPPKRKGKYREENWRQEALRVNRSLDRTTGKGKQKGPVTTTSALAKELAKQAVEQAFRDQTEEPCINPREFMRKARRVAMELWRDQDKGRVENKPKFTTYALAALQEAYEENTKRFFACVQIAADHRQTPSEIKKKAMKTIMDRDVEIVIKLRSMDQ